MATYAAYRHIELDKVGYSKKRVRNPPSDIFNVLCTPTKNETSVNSNTTPRRSRSSNDSFNRLFGSPTTTTPPPRKSSLTKHDVTSRNPVTGNGVDSWDCRPASRSTPRVHTERNPVTGEYYTIVSPATTPTKPVQNGFSQQNGISPVQESNQPTTNGQLTNGHA